MTAIRRSKASTRILAGKRSGGRTTPATGTSRGSRGEATIDRDASRDAAAGNARRAARGPVTGESLLARYRQARGASQRRKLRTELLDRYHSLVEGMARALVGRLPRSVDVDDLVHAGLWGLLQAIDNWRPERGTHFVPFMRFRVRGAMLDELRSMDFVPRVFRRHQREVDRVREELRAQLGREPSDAEIADGVGMPESRMRVDYAIARPPAQASERMSPSRIDGAESADGLDSFPATKSSGEAAEGPLEALTRRDLVERIRSKAAADRVGGAEAALSRRQERQRRRATARAVALAHLPDPRARARASEVPVPGPVVGPCSWAL